MKKVFAVCYSGGDWVDYIAAENEEQAGELAEEGWEEITESAYVRCGTCNALFAFDEHWEDEQAPHMSLALLTAEYRHDCPGTGAGREHYVSSYHGNFYVTVRNAN
jgi:hypothetical protein